ncbi:outer membrane beta-barrel protein [Botryobacter ruber]|uniref:outer membrane beta-barrel protein n=1 Tax=Botryobacter ruber TaxID=2171629 RepID=UPI000E0A1FF1|nr:outer membrane beta-barrel protein [Botryobacter ruber]
MKRIVPVIIAIFMAAATGVSAKGRFTPNQPLPTQDTIVVKMANGAKMVLQLDNMEQLKSFRNYSLDSLITVLIKYTEEMDKSAPGSKEMTVTLGSTEPGGDPEKVTIIVQETGQDGTKKTERHEIRINNKIKIDVEVEGEGDDSKVKISTSRTDSTKTEKIKKDKPSNFGFDVDLGVNTFVNKESDEFIPDLKPLGSRYVSLNWRLKSRVGGSRSPLYLVSGLEFAFNNYMFDRNAVIEEDEDVAFFRRATDISYEKSKLTHSSINLPLMPVLQFKNPKGKEGFTIGAGGFAGYRLGSHSKLKYHQNGNSIKEKGRSSYNLSDFQYGLIGVIGYGDLQLFAKYNMNGLFKDNRGPEMNVLSFGFRLL